MKELLAERPNISDYMSGCSHTRLIKYRIEPYREGFMPIVNKKCYPSYGSESAREALSNARNLASKQIVAYMRRGIRARVSFEQGE